MASDQQIDAFLRDYIALYSREGLPSWRGLFRGDAVVARANADGSVTTWDLGPFYDLQRERFAAGKPIREVLEHTHVERTGPLATVRSEFVWTDGEMSRRGRLMLLLVEDHRALRIQALAFEYLAESTS